MNVQKFIAAAAVLVATSAFAGGTAFAADASAAPAAASAGTAVLAANLNLPVVNINKSGLQSRAEVHAEAVTFVKNYKTTLAVQLEQYKN